jgi:hypothetical protein
MTSKYERIRPSKRKVVPFSKLEELAQTLGKGINDIIGCGYLRQPFILKKNTENKYSLKGYCAKYECTCKKTLAPPDYNRDHSCLKEYPDKSNPGE